MPPDGIERCLARPPGRGTLRETRGLAWAAARTAADAHRRPTRALDGVRGSPRPAPRGARRPGRRLPQPRQRAPAAQRHRRCRHRLHQGPRRAGPRQPRRAGEGRAQPRLRAAAHRRHRRRTPGDRRGRAGALAPLAGLPGDRRAGPRRDPDRRGATARGQSRPGAGGRGVRLPPPAHLPGRLRADPCLDDCCARTRSRHAWWPGARHAGSGVRRARPASCGPTRRHWWPRSLPAGRPVRCSHASTGWPRACTRTGSPATPPCSSCRGRGSASRATSSTTRTARLRRIRIDMSSPVTTRLLWREVRAELARARGDGRHARDHVRAGLADLHAWQSSFGSLDLQSTLVGHGRDLATAGPRARAGERRPAPRLRVVRTRPHPGRSGHAGPSTDRRPGRARPHRAAAAAGRAAGGAHDRGRGGSRSCAHRVRQRRWYAEGAGEVTEPADLDELRAALEQDDAALVAHVVVTTGSRRSSARRTRRRSSTSGRSARCVITSTGSPPT